MDAKTRAGPEADDLSHGAKPLGKISQA